MIRLKENKALLIAIILLILACIPIIGVLSALVSIGIIIGAIANRNGIFSGKSLALVIASLIVSLLINASVALFFQVPPVQTETTPASQELQSHPPKTQNVEEKDSSQLLDMFVKGDLGFKNSAKSYSSMASDEVEEASITYVAADHGFCIGNNAGDFIASDKQIADINNEMSSDVGGEFVFAFAVDGVGYATLAYCPPEAFGGFIDIYQQREHQLAAYNIAKQNGGFENIEVAPYEIVVAGQSRPAITLVPEDGSHGTCQILFAGTQGTTAVATLTADTIGSIEELAAHFVSRPE